ASALDDACSPTDLVRRTRGPDVTRCAAAICSKAACSSVAVTGKSDDWQSLGTTQVCLARGLRRLDLMASSGIVRARNEITGMASLRAHVLSGDRPSVLVACC